ncbi:MAG: beta-galactosidase [Clostridia bacterium]|nr:beta-galactosidase [Clostridia bacterium]
MKYTFKPYEPAKLLTNHLNLGGKNPEGEEINLTNLYFTRGGKPVLPVMAEYHFSRDNCENWHKELAKMKAGGVTIVSSYLFWIHHEEIEGEYDFTGDNDVRRFILDAKDVGLDVVIRVGPWAHGECRNGGLPDWLLKKPFELREDNDEYLALVKKWYARIFDEVKGLFYKDGGNIIGVQLENEYVNNAEHLATLKKIAIDCGLIAPLYTVTGWNSVTGAKIPVDEVVPVFGGYVTTPWTGHTDPIPPTSHFVFDRMRNDTAIGTDVIAQTGSDGWRLPYEKYPFATCELGCGIQVTHHRRPIVPPMDAYTLSLVKLGDGNNLIGYYMYHGGTNKIGKLSTLNESKATGYPNDYPIMSYDFQAPLSEYGEVREQYRLMNMLHMFVADFGDVLAPMEAVDATEKVDINDNKSLRYGLRTNGKSGFVFINHHQQYTALEDLKDVVIDTGSMEFPPIDVKGDICFFMPYNMALGENTLEYATAQPLAKVGDTYFFAKIPGIEAEYKFEGGTTYKYDDNFTHNGIRVVSLDYQLAKNARKLLGTLYIGENCDLYEENGEIIAVQEGEFDCVKWNGERFEHFTVSRPVTQANIAIEDAEKPFEPKYIEELSIGGERKITWKKITANGEGGFAEINIPGDVLQIYADGEMVADWYYFGPTWRVPCKLLYGKECYIAISEMKDDFYREF